VISGLTDRELAELCALADGTLPVDRRAEVEARVDASPELQELVERQRQAVTAAQALEADAESASLRAFVAGLRTPPGRLRRWTPRLALAWVAVVAVAAVAAALLSGGPGAPTVAGAARLALRPAAGPAPLPAGASGTRLAVGLGGVSFPDLARAYGWRAVGVRRGQLGGRDATVVVYRKGDRRLAYAVVAGPGLPVPEGAPTTVRGVPYRFFRVDDRLAVTWRRAGHSCVLIGDAPAAELTRLASWRISPR